MNVGHLTEEEFTDLLSGDMPVAVEQHLLECGSCRAEADRVGSSLAGFNAMSLTWAEREAPRRIRTPFRTQARWYTRPAWSAATAAVVAAAIVFGVHEQTSRQSPTPVIVAHSETTIADDNRLLQEIDREVQVQHVSPVAVSSLGISAGDRSRDSSRRIDN